MRKLLLAVGVIAAGLTATAAVAQTTTTVSPYPGPTVTTLGGATNAAQDIGEKPCPSTFDISFTLFNNDNTQSEVDGIPGDDQRPVNGVVTKSVETTCPVGTALSTGRPLAVVGLKQVEVAQAVRFGRIRVNGRLYPPKPLGSTHTITVRGTGLNGAPRTVTATFRLVPAGRSTSRLARTGTFALKWTPLGVGLVGVGYLLVLATRRRRTA